MHYDPLDTYQAGYGIPHGEGLIALLGVPSLALTSL